MRSGTISGRVTPKTLKMVLDTSLLSTQQYKVRMRVKWSNPRKGVAPSPTPRCSSYWKGSPCQRSPTLLTLVSFLLRCRTRPYNTLWCIDFLTPPTPLIIPHSLHAFLESLMPLKNWCSINARWSIIKNLK